MTLIKNALLQMQASVDIYQSAVAAELHSNNLTYDEQRLLENISYDLLSLSQGFDALIKEITC